MNIYVGNLAWEVTEDDIRRAFAEHGQVASARLINDAYTGKSKGFAFVEMPDAGEAEKAIGALNNKDLKGRPLKVNEARPKSEGGSKGNRGSRW